MFGQCDDLLVDVKQKIASANFLGNKAETDRTNFLAKPDEAQAKIYLKKNSDLIIKLGNISDTSTVLANAPKPKLDDASAINYTVLSATDCVSALLIPHFSESCCIIRNKTRLTIAYTHRENPGFCLAVPSLKIKDAHQLGDGT
jgi:hypothetical protein